MKKNLLLLLTIITAVIGAKAEINGDGYYRVHNAETDRYIYVYDNRGKLNVAATTIDLNAIRLKMGIDQAISDPASVIYVEKHGTKYDFKTQGTSVFDMIGAYVSVREDKRMPGTYWAYGEKGGLTKYLCDAMDDPDENESWLVGEGTYLRNWYITPIDANTDNYFGVSPSISAKGVNYAGLYADFTFTFASANMQAYYVKKLDDKRGLAIIEEMSGVISRNTPLIIKCAGSDKTQNRLNLGGGEPAAPKDNLLKGVYFNYSAVASHTNRVAYDKNTMRVLGKTADGSIGLVTSSKLKYIDANSFYLPVAKGAPAEYKLVTQAEYQNIIDNEVPDVTSVTLNVTSSELLIGETLNLEATVLPDAAAKKLTVTWSSSDSKVAMVDDKGVVKAVGVGSATITAACGGKSATCKVIVKPILAESITLDKTQAEVNVNDAITIVATVQPAETTDKTVTWSSSDATIATVADGVVTGIAEGKVAITAACGDVKAVCQVTVIDPENGIADVVADEDGLYDVYTLSGVNIRSRVATIGDLPAGYYIVNGRKVYLH